jgi:hypothetical protein
VDFSAFSVSSRLEEHECATICVSGRLGGPKIRQITCVWKARCGKSVRIHNLTANLRVSGRLVAQKYNRLRVSGRLGAAKVLEFAILLQIYVCLEGWWPKNTTNYVCLEGSVWQKCWNSKLDCTFTCVWKAGGPKIRQITCVWKARCGKSARIRNLAANLRVSGRLMAQKYDKLRVSGRLGVAKCAI